MKTYLPYHVDVCKAFHKEARCKYLVGDGTSFACSKLDPAPTGFAASPYAEGDNCTLGTKDLNKIEAAIAKMNETQEILERNSAKIKT
jgi:hypothetical protein